MSVHLKEERIVAEVVELGEFGAALESEDYQGEVFLHVSEVPLKREQRLTDVLRKNQVIVVKPLKEDKTANRLFVSLKGITKSEAKSKLRARKEEKSARVMLKKAVEASGLPLSMAEEVEATAVEKFGSLSEAFRSIIETGDKALAKLHMPVELSPALKLRLESELLKRRYVEKRRIEVFFTDPDGVEKLRAIGRKYAEDKKGQSSVTVRTISSPRYEIVVESKRPKKAEAMAEEIVEKVIAEAKSLGGNVRT